MRFVYFPGPTKRLTVPSGTPVRWYASRSGQHDYHASADGVRPLCRGHSKLLATDPRPTPPADPSRDPWTCPACQQLVRRIPPREPVPVKVLNRAIARARLNA